MFSRFCFTGRVMTATRYQPAWLVRRMLYKLYERLHPDESWLAQGAIRFLAGRLHTDMIGLEWGSGRSTAWFGMRLGQLTSIEHNSEWAIIVRAKTEGLSNVRVLHIPLDHPESVPTHPNYDPLPRYVEVVQTFADRSLDFVLVDGHYRQACIKSVLEKIRPAGLLVVDNTDWLPEEDWGVPPSWPKIAEARNVMTQTTIWERPRIAE